MIQDFVSSLWNYRAYPDFLKRRKHHVFFFGAFLSLLFWLFTVCVPVIGFQLRTGGLHSYLQEKLPDFVFELKDGKLSANQHFRYATGRVYIDVNTDADNQLELNSQDMRTLLALNDVVLAVNSERLIYKAGPTEALQPSNVQLIEFSQMEDLSFRKADVLKTVPYLVRAAILVMVLTYFIQLAGFFLWLLVIAAFGRLLGMVLGVRLRYGDIYKLSAYTRSAPVLLGAVLFLFDFALPEYAGLSMLYSLFVLSRVFRYLVLERLAVQEAPGSAQRKQRIATPKSPDEEENAELSRQRDEAADAELPQRDETVPAQRPGAEAEKPQTEPGAVAVAPARGEADRVHPSETEEDMKPQKEPELLLPKRLNHSDIRPSDGWSFGTEESRESAETGAPSDADGESERHE